MNLRVEFEFEVEAVGVLELFLRFFGCFSGRGFCGVFVLF